MDMDKGTALLLITLYDYARNGYIYPCSDTSSPGMSNLERIGFETIYKDIIVKARETVGVCIHCGGELGSPYFGAGTGQGTAFQCLRCHESELGFQL
jgi:hypothetical protein